MNLEQLDTEEGTKKTKGSKSPKYELKKEEE